MKGERQRTTDQWLLKLSDEELKWVVSRGHSILAARHAGAAGKLTGQTLTASDRAQLHHLSRNPGIWGGPLDKGQTYSDDEEISRWQANGWVEVRVRGEKHGFYITDAGRAVLATHAEDKA